MTPELLPCGDRAILVELPDPAARRRFDAALRRDPPAGMVEQVPALRTVLVRLADPALVPAAATHLRALALGDDEPPPTADPVAVGVRYTGDDLPHVADLLGTTVADVVARHTGQLWTVEFTGFMPGFGYLTGAVGGLTVPRRASPRTRVPAGSVALAGEFSGVYPQASPGGWQLIGTTDVVLWDPRRTPPALLQPGARIRFVVEAQP